MTLIIRIMNVTSASNIIIVIYIENVRCSNNVILAVMLNFNKHVLEYKRVPYLFPKYRDNVSNIRQTYQQKYRTENEAVFEIERKLVSFCF